MAPVEVRNATTDEMLYRVESGETHLVPGLPGDPIGKVIGEGKGGRLVFPTEQGTVEIPLDPSKEVRVGGRVYKGV